MWSEGHVWCSPEMHGTITGAFKNQIDWYLGKLSASFTQRHGFLIMHIWAHHDHLTQPHCKWLFLCNNPLA